MLLQLPALPHAETADIAADITSSSSSSSTSRGKGNRNSSAGAPNLPIATAADTVKLWQFAQEQKQALPASHSKLFELLGLGSGAVVWLAAVLAGNLQEMPGFSKPQTVQMLYDRMERAYFLYLQLHELRTNADYQRTAVSKALNSKPALAWEQEQLLLYLLPSLLLYWSAVQPAQIEGGGRAELETVLTGSLTALRTSRRDLSRTSFFDQLQQLQQGRRSAHEPSEPSPSVDLLVTRDVLQMEVRIEAPSLLLSSQQTAEVAAAVQRLQLARTLWLVLS